jgi:hypothetical protein
MKTITHLKEKLLNKMDYYKKHENEPIDSWLRFKEIFNKSGVQGLVGLLESITGDESIKYVFKISQHMNYLVHHEVNIGNALSELIDFCPHFCRVYGGTMARVAPDIKKGDNPFNLKNIKYPLEREILLMEYLDHCTKLSSYIRSERISIGKIMSAIKQVLIAVKMAQKHCDFTHYDLHSSNVMMKKCDPDMVMLYVFEEDKFLVPTNGSYPVIIDYGFSYANTLDNNYLWPNMCHTHAGMISCKFDKFADVKLFLVTISGELSECRDTNTSIKKLSNICKNIFRELKIDWESGWDKKFSKSIADYALSIMEPIESKSALFNKYDYHCLDLIESLIILPFEERDYSKIEMSFKMFLSEFVKIEKEIGNDYYSLYLLKSIVDYARMVRADYSVRATRDSAVFTFRENVTNKLDEISKFFNVKQINFEKLLCGLLCFASNVEGLYHEKLNRQIEYKEDEYAKLPVSSIEEIFKIIDFNIQDEYVFNKKTIVKVIDYTKKEMYDIKVSDVIIDEINSTEPVMRGEELFKLIKEGSKNSREIPSKRSRRVSASKDSRTASKDSRTASKDSRTASKDSRTASKDSRTASKDSRTVH